MTKGKPREMSTPVDRAARLAALMGKTVAEQANAGYSQTWKRSAMYQAMKSDEELMNFTDLMARVVTADSNEKMQEYYQAVSAYYNDPGHSDNVEKIRACLDKAIEAMSVDKTSVQAALRQKKTVE